MLNPSQIHSASDLLFSKWTARACLDALPHACRPHLRDEGYAIQALVETRSAHPLFGWKIAATSTAGQAHIGVTGPLAGRILRERVVAPYATVSLDGNQMKVAELEFAFVMGEDLTPRAKPYSVDEVLAAVASLHPAIEIPDSRYADFVRAGEAQLIADNACAHEFMLGEATKADWRAIDLRAHQVCGFRQRDGETYQRDGIGANVLGDPRTALTWLANELSAIGVTLKAGQAVTTGTCMVPMEVIAGDEVRGDYGPIGQIGIRFN